MITLLNLYTVDPTLSNYFTAINDTNECFIVDNCYQIELSGNKVIAYLQITEYSSMLESATVNNRMLSIQSGRRIEIPPDTELINSEWMVKASDYDIYVYGFSYDKFFVFATLAGNDISDIEKELLIHIIGGTQLIKMMLY
jgi:hypothetical protein